MKKQVILILIAILTTSIGKVQSVVKTNIDNLPAKVSVKAPTINLDRDAMMVDIRNSIVEIGNVSDLIDLSSLNDLSHIEKTISDIQYEITSAVSDTNTGSTYAYANKENTEAENSFSSSYTTAESLQNNDALFSSLSNIKGVDVVYISKTMLGMMPNMNMPGVDIGNMARKLESIEIYSAEGESTSKRLIHASEALLRSGNYETLMLTKDDGSKTAFYIKKSKSNQGSEMLMITEEGNDATIIRFSGNFTVQDIKNLTNPK